MQQQPGKSRKLPPQGALHAEESATGSVQPLTDIGANLAHEAFAQDLDQVIERAYRAGVHPIIVTGADTQSNTRAVQLAKQHSQIYATAGFHPHYAEHFSDDAFDQISALVADPRVVAVGETGLDFYRKLASPGQQEEVFIRLVELACDRELPLFVHERDAHERVYQILHAHRNQLPRVVIHCFTGNKEALLAYLSLDAHIGITGWICDERRGTHLRELLGYIPANRLMIETDAPYLLPRDLPREQLVQKHRNEPAHLRHIAMRIAQYRGCDSATLAKQTAETSAAFFNLESPRK